MKDQIKVLVVDDSLLIRKVVSELLSEEPDIEVVGVAMDGDFAIMKLARILPDVIVLDINMPRMDGLTTLKIISEEYHIPTVILSAFTREGAYTTLQALKYGAIDFICKPSESSMAQNKAYLRRSLVDKIKMAHQIHRKQRPMAFDTIRKNGDMRANETRRISLGNRENSTPPAENLYVPNAEVSALLKVHEENFRLLNGPAVPENLPKIVAIGASTGGTIALEKVLKGLPRDFPLGIVVVQHMPKEFTAVFAETLNQNVSLAVMEAVDGKVVMPGEVHIAPGDAHLEIRRRNTQYVTQLDRTSAPVHGMRPSVDVLFCSLAAAGGKKVVGVVLTGMGKDGAEGVKSLKSAGAHIIAQDEESCVVFGMPKEAIKTGSVDHVLSLQDISSWLMYQANKNERDRANSLQPAPG